MTNTPSMPIPAPIDILIVTALPEERDALLARLGTAQKIQAVGAPTYYLASVPVCSRAFCYQVAVTMLTDMGNVESAQHASRAIADLKPAYVIMMGIAGGIKGEVTLGDVLVARQVFYYEQTKQKPGATDLRTRSYPVDSTLLERALNFTDGAWRSLIKAPRPDSLAAPGIPAVHFAPVAAGEAVIADESAMEPWQKVNTKLAGVEMESYGVAKAAATADHRPGFLAIRGICDYANAEKNDDWHIYAAEAAAAYTVGFLGTGPVPHVRAVLPGLQSEKTLVVIRHQSMEPLPLSAIRESLLSEFAQATVKELALDQTDLYANGRLSDPAEAARRQMDLAQRLLELVGTDEQIKVAYCGIAHVPLLFLAGYHLSNKQYLHFYEHNRYSRKWRALDAAATGYPPIRLDGMPVEPISAGGDVVVRVSVSYPVTPAAVAGIVSHPIASIHLGIEKPQLDVVTSETQLQDYSMAFRSMLDEVHNKLPQCGRIHLFYAGPVALAVNCGRQISKTIHAPVIVYNYSMKDTPCYSWGLTITSVIESADFVVQVSSARKE